MAKKACNCTVCTTASILLIIGALNGGLVVLTHHNLIDKVFSPFHLARVMYVLIALSGVVSAASFFKACPGCKKS